jgi:alpha,alpha-trehalase
LQIVLLFMNQHFFNSTLFKDVQVNNIFADGKTFVDCTPKYDLTFIEEDYQAQKNNPAFSLEKFVEENFEIPAAVDSYSINKKYSIEEHINNLWTVLERITTPTNHSLIPLPYSYIVPGGRFREIYYWDSYFTMLGLAASFNINLIENMVNNFAHLINTIGYIPNGNRTYYIGRSQPPFFTLMVKLLAKFKGENILLDYSSAIEKEYSFWQDSITEIDKNNTADKRVVKLNNHEYLNRYWDEHNTPRPESYKEDIELAHTSTDTEIYRHIRAAAESGWDFSTRWFADENNFTSIHTTAIIPVDLNCLLYHMEETLAEIYKKADNTIQAEIYAQKAFQRKQLIQQYCWNEEKGFYFDYDFIKKQQKDVYSLAALFTLFFKIATTEQAKSIAAVVEKNFLKEGGLLTTLQTSGQQWDAPNGWAPLHYITIKGLENYGLQHLAETIAGRWITLNKTVFERSGKLMEKYNVVDTDLEAGGGEYPGQDGFGWTNGVLLNLMNSYPHLASITQKL